MNDKKRKKISFEHWHLISMILIIYDILSIIFSYSFALWLRFDCLYSQIPAEYLNAMYRTILPYAIVCILVFYAFHLYQSIWRFASYTELIRTGISSFGLSLIYFIFMKLTCPMPLSFHFIGSFLQFAFVLGIRFSYRFVLLLRGSNKKEEKQKRICVFGAGNAGMSVQKDILLTKELNEKVCCFLDDNPNKWGRYVNNAPVIGGRESILEAVQKYRIDKIYVCIPSASAEDKREILNICNETGCELRNLPGLYQLSKGDVTVSQMKKVAIEDLLGREPIKVNDKEILEYIKGKVVLITGGGGSIGSELCRRVAENQPKQLIIFDVYENNAYDIQLELKRKYPNLDIVTLIGSVRDSRKIFKVFEDYRPEIVYHAAAHKHVPLMEDSPCEAVKNNAIGTYKTAYAAISNGCKRFVLISTDKAVNPTNVMGATKRMCEMIIQSFDQKIKEGKALEIPQLFTHIKEDSELDERIKNELRNAKTEFVAVRFGNVLGIDNIIETTKEIMNQGLVVSI